MNNNPSPGNKAGGLTTILEKSLGRGGQGRDGDAGAVSTTMPNRSRAKGFVFMDTPGYDPGIGHGSGRRRRQHSVLSPPAAARPMAASRPPRSSSRPIPTPTARMTDDMDINCGDILDGVSRWRTKGAGDLCENPRVVASGEPLEVRGAGLWRRGVRALADRGYDVRVLSL